MSYIQHLGLQHDDVFQGDIAKNLPYHRMNGKEYCVPSLVVFNTEELERLRLSAESVDRIYWKVLRFAQRNLPDTFLQNQLGLHPSLIPAARIEVPYHGVSRQDWILNDQGIKCIENNTDTPTGVPETAYLAEEMISAYSTYTAASSPMKKEIQRAFKQLVDYYQAAGLKGMIAFSSYGWHLEDKTNTEYLMQAVNELGYEALFVPLEDLEIIPGKGLFANGRQISILYRLYPLEYLVYDIDEPSGRKIGEDLLELIIQGKLGLINPVQSIITQSKGFMALIWSLYEHREETKDLLGFSLFDQHDLQAIEKFLLPTYYENTVFVQSHTPFVAKGYWGREGKGTSLYDQDAGLEQVEWGHLEEEVQEVQEYYEKQPQIYQKRIDMQEVELKTEDGLYTGYLLTGAFVVGGCFAGILPRIGSKITGDMAYYCPAAIHENQ